MALMSAGSIERTVRKLEMERDAAKATNLDEDARAITSKIRRLKSKYKEFSKAAGLREKPERMDALYSIDIKQTTKFKGLENYQIDVKVVNKFSEKQYEVIAGTPNISGTTDHFNENLRNKSDRKNLTEAVAQDIINKSVLTLYQTDRKTLKFISDSGYAVLNKGCKLVTAVPEKLRKKYKEYLEGK